MDSPAPTEDYDVEIVDTIADELQYDSESDLSCPICKAEFVDPDDLKQHESIHEKPPELFTKICDFCEYSYPDLENYAIHIRDVHLSAAKFCRLCSRVFTDFNKYQQHARKHNTMKSDYDACSQCPTFYSNPLELERHELEKHADVTEGLLLHNLYPYLSSVLNINFPTFIKIKDKNAGYTCTKCDYKSNDIDTYIQHLKEKNCRCLTCDSCSKVCRLRKNMFVHLSNSSRCSHLKGDRKLQCKECSQYIRIMYFKNHVKNCKPIKCNICSIVFDSVNNLTDHQVAKHPLSIQVKTCKFCLRQCVGKVSLMKHLGRAHKDELDQYKYKCVDCEMIFKHPQKLFTHFYVKHKDLEPYMCKICDKTFKARKKFTIHIKLEHNSVGFIEFDTNYHVYFAETKTEKPFIPSCVVSEEDRKLCNMYSEPPKSKKNTDEYKSLSNALSGTETEVQTETEKQSKPQKRKKMPAGPPKKKPSIVVPNSSDEDDIPLVGLTQGSKQSLPNFPVTSKLKENRKKLTCKQCNKYCYTKQNYTRHIALHSKRHSKTCIKCNEEFSSTVKLKEHVNTEHKTSKLTDTLKRLLEKKKLRETPHILTMSEKFEKTIKKVPTEECTPAKIKLLRRGTIVKRFIENFTPEDIKDDTVNESSVTIRPISRKTRTEPIIKLTKYKPEPAYTEVKLAMPVKYTPDFGEKVKVKVQLVNGPLKPSAFGQNGETEFVDDNDFYDETYGEEREYIPDVAQEEEVQIEYELPRTIHVPHKIVIPNLPAHHEVSIAHLLPEAPYYKIVKVNDVLNDPIPAPPKPEPKRSQEPIQLPDGTKLVTVNPLAHLLGDRNVDDIMEPLKKKYYKPKVISDVESALTKALEKANMSTRVKKNAANKKKGGRRKVM